jgi:sugar/nucleoside kinase (ribokinase family)
MLGVRPFERTKDMLLDDAAGLKQIVLTLGEHGAALLQLQSNVTPASTSRSGGNDSTSSSSSSGGCSSSGRLRLLVQHVPAATASAINLSGAGDTLTGAFTAALLAGSSPMQALAVGVAAAKVCVECATNVPSPAEGLLVQQLKLQAQHLLAAASTWTFPVAAAL